MHMVGLDADMHDAKVGAAQHDQHRLTNDLVRLEPPQAGELGCSPQADVNWFGGAYGWADPVRLTLALVDLLAPCTLALATPRAEVERLLDMSLLASRHLELVSSYT